MNGRSLLGAGWLSLARSRRRSRPRSLPLRLALLSLVPLVLLGSGCASFEPVKPWEKGMLARPEMTFEVNGLETRYLEHVYTSKENASGGNGVGGGGCGCN